MVARARPDAGGFDAKIIAWEGAGACQLPRLEWIAASTVCKVSS
jgi:hypothetical protein